MQTSWCETPFHAKGRFLSRYIKYALGKRDKALQSVLMIVAIKKYGYINVFDLDSFSLNDTPRSIGNLITLKKFTLFLNHQITELVDLKYRNFKTFGSES